nr:uncharacterized protein LOC106614245 [Bactrocera oleae]
MIEALEEKFKIPAYLSIMVRSYLEDRVLLYKTSEGPRHLKVTSGAAQGSILGPDFWNVGYDGILSLDMPDDTYLVGYADDIAAIITARDTEDARRKLNQVMIRAQMWLDAKEFCLLFILLPAIVYGQNNGEEPFAIYVDVGNEVQNVISLVNKHETKLNDFDKKLLRIQNMQEKFEERFLQLEQNVKTAENVNQKLQAFNTKFEQRLSSVYNNVTSSMLVQESWQHRRNHYHHQHRYSRS